MRLAGLAFLLAIASNCGAIAGDANCRLIAADKAANAKLSFGEFDQKGVTPTTWRALEERGCHAKAAEAADDYLANGPAQPADHKQDVLFHEAQSLAFLGRYDEAAHLVTASIPPDRAGHGELDWTTYMIGTRAFLLRDRPALMAAEAKMAAEAGDGNKMDDDVLRGLLKCFDRPYVQASTVCRPLWTHYRRKH